MKIAACKQCGAAFARKGNRRWCSQKCREEAFVAAVEAQRPRVRELQRKRKPPKKERDAEYYEKRWQEFRASERGRQIIEAKAKIKRVRRTWRLGKLNTCEKCGKEFHPYRQDQQFCSTKCYGNSRIVSKEHKQARCKQWVEDNKERLRKYRLNRKGLIKRGEFHRKFTLGWRHHYANDIAYRLKRIAVSASYRCIRGNIPFDPHLIAWVYEHPQSNCQCCGVEFDIKHGRTWQSPSLDRLIPSLGYTITNTRLICLRCNSVKSNTTAEELERIATYIRRETSRPAVLNSEMREGDDLRIM